MADSPKITVLLADEDSLRRDGLAAVLNANPDFEIVAGCPDGQTALEEIRELRPTVAVVDLNLPGVHGIELVRRVRGESLGTKMIILSGTTDDEMVREVVRAGADAYLLKNGPARHLTDAINYVRDGGQYFSPQLRRDGRDRHLFEEPARVPVDRGYRDPAPPASREYAREDYREEAPREYEREVRREQTREPARESISERRRAQRATRHTADPARFRERLREETSRDLRDRDYEIMEEMADGIRPILDRLDEIENRVMDMEDGDEPVPADPRGWLSAQLSDTLGSKARGGAAGRTVNARDLEARLPDLIEEAVTKRFQTMAGKLQEEIEEQHVKTLETFVKNIQTKLVQRVSNLEQGMTQQAEAMNQLREYNQRTEENLSRLISGVDKLATELPKRLAAAQQAASSGEPEPSRGSGGRGGGGRDRDRDRDRERERERESGARDSRESREKNEPKTSVNIGAFFSKRVLLGVIVAGLLGGAGYALRLKMKESAAAVPPVGKELQVAAENATAASAATALKASSVPANADTKTKMDAAKGYVDRKEYATAEDIYKQIVQAEPNNVEALKALASVLYREDKIEESTQILDRLPKN